LVFSFAYSLASGKTNYKDSETGMWHDRLPLEQGTERLTSKYEINHASWVVDVKV
jgi:hypothetical protein